ncbi:MAG: hypothetical protein ABSC48_00310 [Terracidiphilus sp.]|jgi:hypothetical protein
MIDGKFVWCFVLCALAIWRVAHLLARENGPWDLIVRLRSGLGSGLLGRLMDCFYCLSFLVSLPPAIWLSTSLIGFLIQWMALSATACLVEKTTQGQQRFLRVVPVSRAYFNKVIDGV